MSLNKLTLVIVTLFLLSNNNVFSMSSPFTPASDGCATATAVTANAACTSWTTDGATVAGDPANSCYTGTEDQTIWWQFTATSASMNLNIEDLTVGCPPAVSVYSGGCGGLTEISCNQFTSPVSSFIMAPLVPASTYYVALSYQSGGACGSYVDACIDVCDTPPADICSGATAIDGTPLSTDNMCTTPGPTTNAPTITPGDLCAGSLENSAWFSFTVLATADVVITFDNIVCVGGGAGFQIGYFTGACGSLANLGCSSGSGGTVTTTITGLTAGDVVTMAVDGNAGADCTFDISATNTLALPIELTSFDAKYIEENGAVELTWIIATEINNDFYTIERTKDGETFEVVGIVDGAGNSTMVNDYNLEDKNPYTGTSYYRLKQTDFDGTSVYSDMVAVNVETSFGDLNVFPNPVEGTGYLTFNSDLNDVAEIVIYDVAGKRILAQQYKVMKGNNKFELPTSYLTNGMYFLTIVNDKGTSNIKFIKE